MPPLRDSFQTKGHKLNLKQWNKYSMHIENQIKPEYLYLCQSKQTLKQAVKRQKTALYNNRG